MTWERCREGQERRALKAVHQAGMGKQGAEGAHRMLQLGIVLSLCMQLVALSLVYGAPAVRLGRSSMQSAELHHVSSRLLRRAGAGSAAAGIFIFKHIEALPGIEWLHCDLAGPALGCAGLEPPPTPPPAPSLCPRASRRCRSLPLPSPSPRPFLLLRPPPYLLPPYLSHLSHPPMLRLKFRRPPHGRVRRPAGLPAHDWLRSRPPRDHGARPPSSSPDETPSLMMQPPVSPPRPITAASPLGTCPLICTPRVASRL